MRDPALFARAARTALASGKRIIALKLGRSETGRALVQAHTGSLAGEDRLYDAYFRALGILAVQRPASADEITNWRDGYAWLGGGTWLFSEPQVAIDTLIDLEALGWHALEPTSDGLTIGATCRIAELYRLEGPAEWTALPLLRQCCNAFLASFKIWNAATVGGNICMSLPAGPMISLTGALEGVCTLAPRGAAARDVDVVDFVTGNNANILRQGELLRSIRLPASALTRRSAFRHFSLTKPAARLHC